MNQSKPDDLLAMLASSAPLVENALLLLSEILQGEAVADRGLRSLDEIANAISAAYPDDSGVERIVQGLFGDAGFVGDVDNYHAEDNSFLDRVVDRRIGMPITLSAVVIAVGRRLGVQLLPIGLPGHVVVGIPGESNSFVDAFSGALVGRQSLEQRLGSIFGRTVSINDTSLTPMTITAVVTRVCNNLMRTWADESGKFDRLLELRVRLPIAESEQHMLIEIAEARARFDLAATLREDIDPTDPEIEALWGRLN